MKVIKIIKYVFTFIGIAMLTGTLFMYKSTNEFLEISISSEGTVIDLLASRSSSSSNNSITFQPLVQFTEKKGNNIEFLSSTSSNPPSYSVGEKIEIIYNPESPNKAKIKSFFSIWGGVTIVGSLGFIFFIIGGSIFLFDKKKSKLLKYLKQNGTRIDADFQNVKINRSLTVNGQNPFQIISQWQNPTTSKLHIFSSDNIWFDPSNFITTGKIKVLIDKKNPKKYWVDLSFLPEVKD